ncbi:hypothetical protein HK405_003157 [Cladochytrium tenue]|nr:hypothetical protein HK405_003157 [Cladochytrium tenue]
MVANKDAAERLGLTCSAAAEALTSLLSGKSDSAESISRCSALLILADLLTEVETYLRTVFTPPEKGSLKRWLAIAKNYTTVQSVKEKLTEYDARLSSVSLQVLMAVNSSTWTNVNDIKEMFRACQVAILSEQTKELNAEQARIKRLSGELKSIMKEDVNLFQSSNIDNMRLDQAADLLIDARRRLQLLKEELDLDNTPDDEATRTNIDAITSAVPDLGTVEFAEAAKTNDDSSESDVKEVTHRQLQHDGGVDIDGLAQMMQSDANSGLILPAGWTSKAKDDLSFVYYHSATKNTSWVPPAGTITAPLSPQSSSPVPGQTLRVGSGLKLATNIEVLHNLESFTTSILKSIGALALAIRSGNCNSGGLIADVRQIVFEVGNILAVVDDLPLYALSENVTVDYKVNRLALYNAISELVMATSGATGQFPPSNAVEQVVISMDHVDKSVKDLLVTTKFLLEEREAHERSKSREVIARKPWYLGYDYKPDDILFNNEGKVLGGKLPALVERLTLHDTVDSFYLQAFLLTYRSFTTTKEFFELLKKRFEIQAPTGLNEIELDDWKRNKKKPICVRVFNVIKQWIETYYQEDDEDKEILQEMRAFASVEMQEEDARLGALMSFHLLKLIERREQGLMKKILVTSMGKDVPSPILPRNLKKLKFLDLDPLEIARQLTIIESKMFNRIQPVEFLRKAWSDKESEVAVNINTMIAMSNQVSGWVTQSILSEKDHQKRKGLIVHFIAIAEKCRTLNNFNTLAGILGGLGTAPIHRLKRTWELVPTKNMGGLEALRETMDSTKNFSRYRETLHSINPPCVPLLWLYLTDLTFIEEGGPNFFLAVTTSATGESAQLLINFGKRMKTSKVVREVQQFQSTSYQLTQVPELQEFLRESFTETLDETDLYNLSLALEPRPREDEKIARMLVESGFL